MRRPPAELDDGAAEKPSSSRDPRWSSQWFALRRGREPFLDVGVIAVNGLKCEIEDPWQTAPKAHFEFQL
jgi:hypothetical protein